MCGSCRFVYCCDRGKLVCGAGKRDASADFSASVSDHGFCDGQAALEQSEERKLFDENLLILLATAGAFAVHRYSEAVGAMLFFQIGKLLELISMSRTRKSIEKFMDIRPQYANLKISGGEMQVPPEDLNPRQVIIIKPGERIPVDAIVTQGSSTLDTKALTGESEPRHVKIGSHIYSGSINLSGVLEARVLKASADSTASRIIDMISNADNRRAQTENFCRKIYPVLYTACNAFRNPGDDPSADDV